MKRILLSTASVALFAVGACLLFGRQECVAVSRLMVTESATQTPVPANTEVTIGLIAAAHRDHADDILAQAEPLDDLRGSAPAPTKQTIRVPRTKTVYEDHVVEVEQVTPLQQQYSVLMLKRAQRMTEEELSKAIEELEVELKEQDEAADTELQKAVEILNQLQENSSGTPAARRAEAAIRVLQGTKAPPATAEGVPFYNSNEVQFEQPLNPLPTY